ncbi:MAG TPA: DMT family transporter [Desulfobacteraceae bacterium]|nr:MAG: EamA/RhaT family transporter [Deltaproteobacteria bacterium]HHE73685.1 DMT family transporter [Desulfobacteraceae bacterium]
MSSPTHNHNHKPGIHPYFILISGILAISTGAIFVRMADAPSLVIAAYRVGLAALILVPVTCWKSHDELRSLSSKDLKSAFLSGAFLAMHFATWISSLKFTTISNSVVLVSTSPLWVGVLAPLFIKEKIKRITMISIFLSIIGCVIIGSGDFTAGGRALWGDLLALTGGFCAAGYLILGRTLRQRVSLLVYVSLCYGSAAIILWSAVLAMGLRVSGFSSQTLWAIWAMALISQIIGHSSYNWALRYCSATLVALSFLGEPFVSTILAYLLFQEDLTLTKTVGGLIILCGIYLAARSEPKVA